MAGSKKFPVDFFKSNSPSGPLAFSPISSSVKNGDCAQSCPILCDPMDCKPPASSIHGISWQEYWSGLPFPTLEDLPYPKIKFVSPALAGRFFISSSTWEAPKWGGTSQNQTLTMWHKSHHGPQPSNIYPSHQYGLKFHMNR